jgi:hypothetical protein
MGRRRNSSSVTNFLSDIVDDIKDFVDDEIIDRGRDTERDLRKAGRNWFDSDDDDRDRGNRRDEISELHAAIEALTAKVDELATAKK